MGASEHFLSLIKKVNEAEKAKLFMTLSQAARPSKNKMFLDMAKLVSTRSTCSRLHVGCVITDWAGEKISIGYNGGPKGGRNHCAREGEGKCGDIHAEINAIINAGGLTGPLKAYVTISPCELCAIALINAGVKEVYIGGLYRTDEGVQILEEMNIPLFIYPFD